jgi:predicted metal-dependent peptidase
MATDIIAVWNTCKTLIQQVKSYANAGIDVSKDDSGRNKAQEFLSIPEKTDDQKEVTKKSIPQPMLNALNTNFEQVIKFITAYMLQGDENAFYGMILIGTDSVIDYSQRGVLDLDVDSDPIKIKYNPLFIEDVSLNQLIGDTINELIKLVYEHPTVFAKANPSDDPKRHKDLELGSSCSSSSLVQRDITLNGTNNRVKLPDKVYTKSDLELDINKSLNDRASLEYYYKMCQAYRKEDQNQPQKQQQQQQGSQSQSGMPSPSPSGQGNQQQPGQNPQSYGGQPNSNSVATPENNSGSMVHHWEKQSDPADADEKMKQTVKAAYDNLSDKQRGLIPAGIVEQIEAMFRKPELNWKQILRKYVGIIPVPSRPSKVRLNRRQPERFDLSGRLPKRKVRIVCCFDTSGSMSDDDLQYCANEVFNILKGYETEVTVIECDAEVNKVYVAKKPKDIQCKFAGRGGTSYVPAIEYINSHKFRDAVMIYFTDGYGDSSIPRPLTYRNLWVIVNGNESNFSLSKDGCYGEVKSLMKDQDYMDRKNGF